MTEQPSQELLPPEPDRSTSWPSWLQWLVDPEPPRFLLPATGLLILVLDWLLFPKEAVTLGLAAPFTSIVGFVAGSIGTYRLQRRYALNTQPVAWAKALIAGFLVGVPFPLAGTLVGGWVLATSGLASWKKRLFNEQILRR
ncbi:MAG: hypothetical protein WD738_10550 [Pirellulales bacterium]